jgi:SAM-dependent methyltransferase
MNVAQEMWEDRFSGEDYAYGTEPNGYFKEVIDTLPPGRILLPADGEGRNGVYAATLGWDVHALDFSHNARNKALELARRKNVNIHYLISDIFLYPYPKEKFDAVALIYVHMPAEKRQQLHRHAMQTLKPGGTIILEGFGKDQLRYASGGPRDENMLFSARELEEDFKDMNISFLEEREVIKQEGPFHDGKASVVRLVATKPIDC